MLKQHLITALVHIRRSPYQAVSAILIMTLTFFAATLFIAVAYVLSQTIHYFETTPQVIAFLKSDADPDEISSLTRKLEGDPRIKGDVKFVSTEEAFRIFKETADNPLVTELVSPEILPASVEFSVSDLSFTQSLIDEVKKEPIVESVEFTGSLGGEQAASQVIDNLQRFTNYIRFGGIALLSFLFLTATSTLLVVIGMRVAARREEINVLTLLGATPGFVRLPFLFEGMLYATAGAFIGFTLGGLLLLYLMPNVAYYFGEIPILPAEIGVVILNLAGLLFAELFVGAFLGTVGAWFAISRYLRI